MSQLPVSEPAQTTIAEPDGSLEALGRAVGVDEVSAVAAHFPTCLAAWATLGELALQARHTVQAYAYFRVGYHRGLDRIRKAGWRGSGRVPWAHEGNRGFLRSLHGLGLAAAAIGERDEAERCRTFLADLAPDWPRQ
jgi:Protein of unknown function (DUF3151)